MVRAAGGSLSEGVFGVACGVLSVGAFGMVAGASNSGRGSGAVAVSDKGRKFPGCTLYLRHASSKVAALLTQYF